MRYSAEHKQAVREKLVTRSRALAKQGGFEQTGVDALMGAIGLTGGAFYSHFGSKAELFAEIVAQELAHSARLLGGEAESTEEPGPDALARALQRYLSPRHAKQPDAGCALPALGAEIARADPQVRATVEKSLKQLQRQWAAQLAGDGDQAWALMAQCVGAIVLARVVESERTRGEILAANRRVAAEALSERS